MDMSLAAQKARSGPDHVALAKRYDDAAREMQAKVQEHEKQLADYEYNSSLISGYYGVW